MIRSVALSRPTRSLSIPLAVLLGAALYSTLLVVVRAVPRHDCLLLPLALFFAFRQLDTVRFERRGSRFALLLGTAVILLGGALLQLWTMGYEGRSAVVGGVIPWSDSHDYASDSLRMLHGENSSSFSSKRPFFSALLAGLLRVSGGNLRVALVILLVIGAVSIALVTCEVWRTHGARSAWLVFVILYFFERRWTGFVQTEHLGLPLGAMAFVLCWRAAQQTASAETARRRWLVVSALFALALGLLARPGPFFVLPAIMAWAAWREDRRERLRIVGLGIVAVGVAFALNRIAIARLGTGTAFWDYPRIVFGMLHGEDSTYFCQLHPDICALPVQDEVAAANRIVWNDVLAKPSLVVTGLGGSLVAYFVSPTGLFSFVWYNPDERFLENGPLVRAIVQQHGVLGPIGHWYTTLGLYSLLNALGMGVLGVGFTLGVPIATFRAFRARATLDAHGRLLLFVSLGLIASAPFLPPWITPTLQTGTATLPFLASLPAVIFFARRSPASDGDEIALFPRDAVMLWAPLVSFAAAFLLVLFARLSPLRPDRIDRSACASPEHPQRVVLHVLRDTIVVLTSAQHLSIRDKSLRDLDGSLSFMGKHYPDVVESIDSVKHEGTKLAYAYDWCSARARIVVDDRGVLDEDGAAWMTADVEVMRNWHIIRLVTPSASPAP